MQINNQPIEKPVDGMMVDVVKVWHTIQGEGPFAGRPAIFIRLAGCNLQCPACDTDYTTGRHSMLPQNLVDMVTRANHEHTVRLVVITGGEPFRQPLWRFVPQLISRGYSVQIETNGTLHQLELFKLVHMAGYEDHLTIVCSPKTPEVNVELRKQVDAWKYVLEDGFVDEDGLPTKTLGGFRPARPGDVFRDEQVYLQPMDAQDPEASERNLKAAVQSCLTHGYRLSCQIHKTAGLE